MSQDSERTFDPARNTREHTDVFYGPFGLRAGWGLALYVLVTCLGIGLLLGLVSLLPHAVRSQFVMRREPTALALGVNEGILLLALGLASLAVAHLEHRRAEIYGLGLARSSTLVPGLLTGLVLLSALVWTLHAGHLLFFDADLLHGLPAVRSGLRWAVAFLLVGAFEEYAFRGYLQYALTRGFYGLGARLTPKHAQAAAFSLSAVLVSLLFAGTHLSNHGETAPGIAAVFVAGLVFSYALWRTGTLWWGIGFHTAWDWAQTFLYGVPDSGQMGAGRLFATHAAGNALLSGGAAGPEGSVYVLPALLLVVVAVRFLPQAPRPLLAEDPLLTGRPSDTTPSEDAIP